MLADVLIAAAFSAAALVTIARADCGFPCCLCGPVIAVKLRIVNTLYEPFFNETTMVKMGQRELIFFLEAAADKDKKFRFSANYGQFGFFITTINGRTANYTADKTWWKITDQYNIALNKGVSSYVPSDKDLIIFTFTKGSEH